MMRPLCGALLVLLSVVGVGRAGEKEIIERLENAGRRSWEHDLKLVVLLGGKAVADLRLADLCELHRLRILILYGDGMTDAEMRTVGGLTQLKSLSLGGTAVSDKGLKKLKGLRD